MACPEGNIDFNSLELYMSQFGGGEIYISKEFYHEGIAIIYLNHTEKRNAISGKMMVDFRKCVKELEQWEDGKAVLLCGLGENFCSGGDLDFARACGTSKDAFCMSALMHDVLNRYRKLPMLTFSLIHGPTLGGGAEISIFSDQILVTDDVKFGLVQAKMGIITAWGATTRLVQLLGEKKAMHLLLTAKILSAEDCLEYGIASAILPTSAKKESALDYIRQHTFSHHSIVRSYKKSISFAANNSFEDSIIFERELFCKTWGAEPNREALKKNLKHVKNKI